MSAHKLKVGSKYTAPLDFPPGHPLFGAVFVFTGTGFTVDGKEVEEARLANARFYLHYNSARLKQHEALACETEDDLKIILGRQPRTADINLWKDYKRQDELRSKVKALLAKGSVSSEALGPLSQKDLVFLVGLGYSKRLDVSLTLSHKRLW